ncbi:uncharacterized protein BcabD6B2_08030 [Babesia caballi]|uniref:Uncharacterized protein n=1 Tax=Babesia caballi TaxID=5871 RepID=A0AAV4LNP8_BABCB|nr:hypothetical protein BcabD6B2_08030 [Babesia caballi]
MVSLARLRSSQRRGGDAFAQHRCGLHFEHGLGADARVRPAGPHGLRHLRRGALSVPQDGGVHAVAHVGAHRRAEALEHVGRHALDSDLAQRHEGVLPVVVEEGELAGPRVAGRGPNAVEVPLQEGGLEDDGRVGEDVRAGVLVEGRNGEHVEESRQQALGDELVVVGVETPPDLQRGVGLDLALRPPAAVGVDGEEDAVVAEAADDPDGEPGVLVEGPDLAVPGGLALGEEAHAALGSDALELVGERGVAVLDHLLPVEDVGDRPALQEQVHELLLGVPVVADQRVRRVVHVAAHRLHAPGGEHGEREGHDAHLAHQQVEVLQQVRGDVCDVVELYVHVVGVVDDGVSRARQVLRGIRAAPAGVTCRRSGSKRMTV